MYCRLVLDDGLCDAGCHCAHVVFSTSCLGGRWSIPRLEVSCGPPAYTRAWLCSLSFVCLKSASSINAKTTTAITPTAAPTPFSVGEYPSFEDDPDNGAGADVTAAAAVADSVEVETVADVVEETDVVDT